MKDQIIMSKENGNCAVAVPLFRAHDHEHLANMDGYSLQVTSAKPLAYAVDMGDAVQLINAEFLQDKVEWLGDL